MGGKLPGKKMMEFNSFEVELMERAIISYIRKLELRQEKSDRPERISPLLNEYTKLYERFWQPWNIGR